MIIIRIVVTIIMLLQVCRSKMGKKSEVRPKSLDQCFSTFFEPRHIFDIKKIPQHTTNQKCYKMTHFSLIQYI